MQNHYANPFEAQNQAIDAARDACIDTYGIDVLFNSTKPFYNESVQAWMCPAFWDDILCWPNTPENTLANAKCPTYVIGFDKEMNNASRICTQKGEWFVFHELNKYWTNYTQCYESERATVLMDLPSDLSQFNGSLIATYIPIVKTISKIGYDVSLCALIIAFAILFSIKKLHCPRNKLHMNLFASFIFRALVLLIKDLIFVEGVGFASNVAHKNGRTYLFEDFEASKWNCKLMTSLWEFFIIANYSWILMEGLYLHNLIFRALSIDSYSNIKLYIALGWGLPVFVIVPWVVARIMLEDTLCWTVHENELTFLIIRIPIMISILINLVLFVKIAFVLFSKLRSPLSEEAKRYQKWAKSTLVLVPLFGVHYAIFLGMSYYMRKDEIVELIWLVCDQLFGSFQGFFVAVLYCFLNGEVRTELKPHIRSCLKFCTNNTCLRYCCNCNDDPLRSARTRSSVCTMMSSSSLYNNGTNQHHRYKVRWDCLHHPKNAAFSDKTRDNVCRPGVRSWQDISPRRSCKLQGQYSPIRSTRCSAHLEYCSNGSMQTTEPACLNCQTRHERCHSEPQLGVEMISMIPKQHGKI